MTVSQSMYRNKLFNTCTLACIPNGEYVHPNKVAGLATHYIYIINGSLTVSNNKGEQLFELNKGDMKDVSPYIGTELILNAGPNGWHHVAFNFLPKEKRMNVEMIHGPQTRNIVGSEKEQSIFCIEGELYCDDKKVDIWKSASIPQERTVSVTIPEGSLAAFFTEK